MANPDGSGEQVVVPNPVNSTTTLTAYITPADLSPDGKEIAFSVNPGAPVAHSNQLFVTPIGGGQAPKLLGSAAYTPRWSPDGAKIAYSQFHSETQTNELTVANADGSGAHVIATDGIDPTWSPDGSKLAFATNSSGLIKTINADGSGARTLGPGFGAVWSPSGGRIALNSGTVQAPTITVENPDGSAAHLVTGLTGNLDDWSPTGTELLVSIGTAPVTIEIVDATSGARKSIVTDKAIQQAASWQRPR